MLLTIQDNGVGIGSFDEKNQSDGHGLMIMRERAEAVGGTLRVESIAGSGTKVEASLPIHNNGKSNMDHEEQE